MMNQDFKKLTSCIQTVEGTVTQLQQAQALGAIGLSTIDEFKNCDTHSKERHNGINYQVSSVTLTDLLQEHNAPHDIDYLSIDTEGSEYEILASHDFNKYSFKVITCEHNFTSKRNEICRLLLSKGYERKYLRNDKTDFDDWYVKTY